MSLKNFLMSLLCRIRPPEEKYEPTYQRGDRVQSIYGGPVMTVSKDGLIWVGGKIPLPRVWVAWYDKNMAIQKQRFQHSELKRVP